MEEFRVVLLVTVFLFIPLAMLVWGILGIGRLFSMGERGLGIAAVVLLFVVPPVGWIVGISAFFRTPQLGSPVQIAEAARQAAGLPRRSTRRAVIWSATLLGVCLALGLVVAWGSRDSNVQAQPTTTVTTIAETTTTGGGLLGKFGATTPQGAFPRDQDSAEEWAQVDELMYAENSLLLTVSALDGASLANDHQALANYASEAGHIADGWGALTRYGSRVASEAYICKDRGLRALARAFKSVNLGNFDSAQAAFDEAEVLSIRGSDLLDELELGTSLLAPGSPRSCR